MLNEEKLREIRERVDNATRGPWHSHLGMIYGPMPEIPGFPPAIANTRDMYAVSESDEAKEQHIHDAVFIAHTRDDIPALLDHIAMSGRSTPLEYTDCARVHDARGSVWSYSEPADVWHVVDDEILFVVSTSARSYQRLVAEFGPLHPITWIEEER